MDVSQPQGTFRRFIEDQPTPLISYGMSYIEACRFHIETTLNASRIYLLLLGSLARNTDVREKLEAALGNKIVGVRVGMRPHTL